MLLQLGRKIGELGKIISVGEALAEENVHHRAGQRAVAAGPEREVEIGHLGRSRLIGVDHHQLEIGEGHQLCFQGLKEGCLRRDARFHRDERLWSRCVREGHDDEPLRIVDASLRRIDPIEPAMYGIEAVFRANNDGAALGNDLAAKHGLGLSKTNDANGNLQGEINCEIALAEATHGREKHR